MLKRIHKTVDEASAARAELKDAKRDLKTRLLETQAGTDFLSQAADARRFDIAKCSPNDDVEGMLARRRAQYARDCVSVNKLDLHVDSAHIIGVKHELVAAMVLAEKLNAAEARLHKVATDVAREVVLGPKRRSTPNVKARSTANVYGAKPAGEGSKKTKPRRMRRQKAVNEGVKPQKKITAPLPLRLSFFFLSAVWSYVQKIPTVAAMPVAVTHRKRGVK